MYDTAKITIKLVDSNPRSRGCSISLVCALILICINYEEASLLTNQLYKVVVIQQSRRYLKLHKHKMHGYFVLHVTTDLKIGTLNYQVKLVGY